jgi:UDP-2-acetamido-2-deoxy-ribo-hexuluronate aminotransferase
MKFRDLRAQYDHLKERIDANILEVLRSTAFIGGRQVTELEETLAKYVGVKHCISCANGTDALQLVLMAWGVGEGDAVFVPDFTFFATAGCASIVGATPVFVDVDPRTFNIDVEDLEKKIAETINLGVLTPKVIIPVDLFGLPADYPSIERIAKQYDLKVLEDGAQGFGGNINGQIACSFGDAAITSFFPAKPLGCYGDGGAMFTNDTELAVNLHSLKAQGRSPEDKYDNRAIGMNSRLDTLQAAILLVKFEEFVEKELDASNRIASEYTARLRGVVETPFIPSGYCSSWAQYTIILSDEETRNELKAYLQSKCIPSMIYYPRGMHQQTAYKEMNVPDSSLPVTSQLTKCVLSLPMHPYLTDDDIEEVCSAVRHFIQDV